MEFKIGDIVQNKKITGIRWLITGVHFWGYNIQSLRSNEYKKLEKLEVEERYILVSRPE